MHHIKKRGSTPECKSDFSWYIIAINIALFFCCCYYTRQWSWWSSTFACDQTIKLAHLSCNVFTTLPRSFHPFFYRMFFYDKICSDLSNLTIRKNFLRESEKFFQFIPFTQYLPPRPILKIAEKTHPPFFPNRWPIKINSMRNFLYRTSVVADVGCVKK